METVAGRPPQLIEESATLKDWGERLILRAARTGSPPAAAAGIVTWLRTARVGAGLTLAACVLITEAAIDRKRCPDHLLPLAGIAMSAVTPALGILLAGAL